MPRCPMHPVWVAGSQAVPVLALTDLSRTVRVTSAPEWA